MTNHPGRQRPPQPAPPTVPEPSEPRAVEPPGPPNQGAAYAVQTTALLGRLINELAQMLPVALYDAMARALSTVPVMTRQMLCAPCLVNRLTWDAVHKAELKAAEEAMAAARDALPEDSPQRGQLSPLMFLPPHLQPSQDPANPNPRGIPDISVGIITVGGTTLCAEHAPADLPVPGKRPLLVAQGHIPAR